MWKNDVRTNADETMVVLCTTHEAAAQALVRMLTRAGVECRLVPAGAEGDGEEMTILVEETDAQVAELLLAKRKKDVEEEEEFDDEEEEEDDLEEDEDEDEDYDDELDDDDDDIFYDDDDDD